MQIDDHYRYLTTLDRGYLFSYSRERNPTRQAVWIFTISHRLSQTSRDIWRHISCNKILRRKWRHGSFVLFLSF